MLTNNSERVSSVPTPPRDEIHSSTEHTKARSPSASRLKESITGLVHRLKEAISPPRDSSPGQIVEGHRGRSPSRKPERNSLISTGRGGAGNMIATESREWVVNLEREESAEGERFIRQSANQPRSHGRGGAGNIRSPSRDPAERLKAEVELRKLEDEEREIELAYDDRARTEPISIGRGGAGNIIHS